MMRLVVMLFLGAVVADYYNLLPIEFSEDLRIVLKELKDFFGIGIEAVKSYSVQLAFTFLGLFIACLVANY